jgi:cysteinyl-tRNA synthetase
MLTAEYKTDFVNLLLMIEWVLGLNLYTGRPDITAAQKQLIAQRETARKAKDWAKADQLRDQLAQQDLAVEDTPHGPRWRRTKLTLSSK